MADFDRDAGRVPSRGLSPVHTGRTPGPGSRWGGSDLRCPLTLWKDGCQSGFDSAFARGDGPGVATGFFVGAEH